MIDFDEGLLLFEFCEYYVDMIEYMNKLFECIVKVMKKVMVMVIDSDELFIFNDFE